MRKANQRCGAAGAEQASKKALAELAKTAEVRFKKRVERLEQRFAKPLEE